LIEPFFASRMDDDDCAARGEFSCGGLTDAGRSARDDRDLA
jgi:hypothetical protein